MGYSAALRNTIFKWHEAIRLVEDTFSLKSDGIGLQDTNLCHWFITYTYDSLVRIKKVIVNVCAYFVLRQHVWHAANKRQYRNEYLFMSIM